MVYIESMVELDKKISTLTSDVLDQWKDKYGNYSFPSSRHVTLRSIDLTCALNGFKIGNKLVDLPHSFIHQV